MRKVFRKEIDINLFIASIALHLLLTTALTIAQGVITRDTILVEVGFKIAIALVSLNIAIQALNNFLGIGKVLLISLIMILLYLMNLENILLVAIAYIVLCISISVIYRPSPYHRSYKLLYYIEKVTLYLVPTTFLLSVFHNHLTLLCVVIITAILILIMELRIVLLFSINNLGLYLSRKLKNRYTKTGSATKLTDILSYYTLTKTVNKIVHRVGNCLKLIGVYIKVEESIKKSMYKISDAIVNLAQNLVKIEKYFENIFHKIAEAVETLQHKMEHSFILLLFLMGLLLLIAIMFYILLLTV